MNDSNKEQQSLQLELPQDVAQGEYANFAIITPNHQAAPTAPFDINKGEA